MGVAHVGLVHRDPCECKVKGFHAVSSIKRNVSKRHLQGMRQRVFLLFTILLISIVCIGLHLIDVIIVHLTLQLAAYPG